MAPKPVLTVPDLPELTLVGSPGRHAEVLVVGLASGPDGPRVVGSDALEGTGLLGELVDLGATGKAGSTHVLPTRGDLPTARLLAVGLGEVGPDGPSAEQVRRASGVAARALAGTTRATTTLSTLDLGAAAEGSVLGAHVFRAYRSAEHRSPAGSEPLAALELVVDSPRGAPAKAALARATAVARAVLTARVLVDTPPNDLYPASFADHAAALGAAAGLDVEVLDEKALAKGGYGGILGVGQGSSRPPRLVRLTWDGGGRKARKNPSVALVGKGITFDTGGISLKPGPGMEAMTSDMGGAAAVVATVVAAAQLALPVRVTAWVPMAENMPSSTAQRPGDVLTQYGGRTVEVLNTDAEGRLVLADAMVRACEDDPDYLIDTATLTGAQVVGLGNRTPGVMGTDEFRDRVARLSQEVGEGGWAMPLPDELREGLDSRVADLANIAGDRAAGMLVAAVFLREFVAEGVEWAHVDVAGPAFNTGSPHGYTGKGGTGVPVRTILAVLDDIAEHG